MKAWLSAQWNKIPLNARVWAEGLVLAVGTAVTADVLWPAAGDLLAGKPVSLHGLTHEVWAVVPVIVLAYRKTHKLPWDGKERRDETGKEDK